MHQAAYLHDPICVEVLSQRQSCVNARTRSVSWTLIELFQEHPAAALLAMLGGAHQASISDRLRRQAVECCASECVTRGSG